MAYSASVNTVRRINSSLSNLTRDADGLAKFTKIKDSLIHLNNKINQDDFKNLLTEFLSENEFISPIFLYQSIWCGGLSRLFEKDYDLNRSKEILIKLVNIISCRLKILDKAKEDLIPVCKTRLRNLIENLPASNAAYGTFGETISRSIPEIKPNLSDEEKKEAQRTCFNAVFKTAQYWNKGSKSTVESRDFESLFQMTVLIIDEIEFLSKLNKEIQESIKKELNAKDDWNKNTLFKAFEEPKSWF